MSKFKQLTSVYMLPFLTMFVFPLIKVIEVNGIELGIFGLMVFGFLFGMMLEGVFMVCLVTFGILMGWVE